MPYTSNKFDLGTTANQWKNLYVDGVGHIDELNFGQVTITEGYASNVSETVLSTTYKWLGISGSLDVSGSVMPTIGPDGTTSTHGLGTPIDKWKSLHLSGPAHVGTISASAIPTSLNTATKNEFYTLSGSQIFSGSAFIGTGPTTTAFVQAFVSASIFVFQKPS